MARLAPRNTSYDEIARMVGLKQGRKLVETGFFVSGVKECVRVTSSTTRRTPINLKPDAFGIAWN